VKAATNFGSGIRAIGATAAGQGSAMVRINNSVIANNVTGVSTGSAGRLESGTATLGQRAWGDLGSRGGSPSGGGCVFTHAATALAMRTCGRYPARCFRVSIRSRSTDGVSGDAVGRCATCRDAESVSGATCTGRTGADVSGV
jgi:hypothetical protein